MRIKDMTGKNPDITDFKQLENMLIENEKRYRSLFEESRDAVFFTTREGKVVDANKAAIDLFGITEEDLPNLNAIELYENPADRLKFQQEIEETGAVRDYEVRMRRKDGTGIDCLQTTTIWRANDGSILGYQGIIRDITAHKKADKALQESEKRYRNLYEESKDPIYSITRDGKFIDVNQALLDFAGVSRDEIMKTNVLEFYVNPDDRVRFQQEIERNGAVRDFEVQFREKDGTVHDALLTSTLWRANDGSIMGYQGIIHDVTEQKKLENALKESEEKLRAILAGIKDLITIQNKDLDIIWINQSIRDLWGDVIGKKCYEVYKGLSKPCSDCYIEEIFNEGKTVVIERSDVLPDGKKIDLLITSSPIRDSVGNIVAIVELEKDITARRNLEKQLKDYAENLETLVDERTLELRDSEERYRGLYDSSIDGIASATMDGNIIECNQAFADMFGYSKNEIKIMNYLDFIPGKWRDIVARIISEQILPRGFSDVLEIEGIKQEGIIFPASARIWVIKDEDGRPARMWILVRDITERKKLEGKLKSYTEKLKRLDEERAEELRRKTVELEVLNKELEAFSYAVSHDLRAPLRSINGFSKALLDDYIDVLDAEGRDYLQRVRKATKRMAEIIDELLALSRVTRTEMHREKVDLSNMVHEVLTELQESQPERQVEFIVAPGLVADGDARLLSLVFDNLLGNAWKFTGNKSNAQIEFGVTWKGIDRVFFVRDNGAGFNMEYVNKLFGAFQRLHSPEEFPGVGVGLATVKRIINRHGGRVWAEGEVDKGATFYFTL